MIKDPRIKAIIVTISIIVLNCLFYFLEEMFVRNYWMVFGNSYVLLAEGQWYRLLTSMFSHASVQHLASNAIAIYGVGQILERVLGKVRFLSYYLLCGILGGLFSSGLHFLFHDPVISIGASGAAFGLFGIFLVLSLRGNIRGVPIWRIALYLGLNFIYGFLNGTVDNFGHLGGLIIGLLFGLIASVRLSGKRR